MPPKITLYVDTVSPFAYIAYYVLRHDPAFKKCEINYVPMFLGGVMKACGNTPPITIKNKDKWLGREIKTWSTLFSVPWNTISPSEYPPDFPPLTLPNQRALCALTATSSSPQDSLTTALDALYHAYWVDHKATHTPEILSSVLTSSIGPEITEKVKAMMGKEGKEILARNTDQALEDGAFGLPWFVCVNEEGEKRSFWGVDHLVLVTEFLELEKPRMEVEEWKKARL